MLHTINNFSTFGFNYFDLLIFPMMLTLYIPLFFIYSYIKKTEFTNTFKDKKLAYDLGNSFYYNFVRLTILPFIFIIAFSTLDGGYQFFKEQKQEETVIKEEYVNIYDQPIPSDKKFDVQLDYIGIFSNTHLSWYYFWRSILISSLIIWLTSFTLFRYSILKKNRNYLLLKVSYLVKKQTFKINKILIYIAMIYLTSILFTFGFFYAFKPNFETVLILFILLIIVSINLFFRKTFYYVIRIYFFLSLISIYLLIFVLD